MIIPLYIDVPKWIQTALVTISYIIFTGFILAWLHQKVKESEHKNADSI